MRLLVTGKTGQIVTALRQHAGTVPDLTVLTVGRPEFDLAAPDRIAQAIAAARPDVVINAAAYTAVDQAEQEPELAMAINGDGAGLVARAARAARVPIIHISTDYVFDGTKSAPYVETDRTAPISAYGRSKLRGEELVARENRDHAILRTAWVYAASGKNFVQTMLRLAATRAEIAVVADQTGVPNYAPDLAAAIVTVAGNLAARNDDPKLRGIFHLSAGGDATWAAFAEAIFAAAAPRGLPSATVRPIPTSAYPTPARRPANSRLAGNKLAAIHGVTMPDWHDALHRCMDKIAATTQGVTA